MTDSALPGRNEDVSFFCASSNLPPWLANAEKTTNVTAKTIHLAVRPAGRANRLIAWCTGYASCATSSSGVVTGSLHAKRSHT